MLRSAPRIEVPNKHILEGDKHIREGHIRRNLRSFPFVEISCEAHCVVGFRIEVAALLDAPFHTASRGEGTPHRGYCNLFVPFIEVRSNHIPLNFDENSRRNILREVCE